LLLSLLLFTRCTHALDAVLAFLRLKRERERESARRTDQATRRFAKDESHLLATLSILAVRCCLWSGMMQSSR